MSLSQCVHLPLLCFPLMSQFVQHQKSPRAPKVKRGVSPKSKQQLPGVMGAPCRKMDPKSATAPKIPSVESATQKYREESER